MMPSGKAGKEYIDECTRLILEWVSDSQLQSIAIKALNDYAIAVVSKM